MLLSKGHNNLTKLNEIASCICGGFQRKQHMALDRNFISSRNFIIFFVFSKLNTPELKHHIGEDHSNSTKSYHSSQQLRFGSCFLLPTSFKFMV